MSDANTSEPSVQPSSVVMAGSVASVSCVASVDAVGSLA